MGEQVAERKSLTFEANEVGCPWCGAIWEVEQDEEMHTDDIRDETEQKCPDCGGTYQQVCTHVDMFFKCYQAKPPTKPT